MEKTANSNDAPGLLARIAHGARSLAARIDDGARTLVETTEETSARRAGLPKYSRTNPNPAWGDKRPGRGDRIVGSQVVAPDSAPPPGERIALEPFASPYDHGLGGGEAVNAEGEGWENGGAVEFMLRRTGRTR